MDKEKLQQGLNEYEAKVAKAVAKFPERKNFEAQRLYTPLDIEDFDYGEKTWFSRAISLYTRRAAYNVPRTPVDHARLRRFCHGRRNQRAL